MDTLIGQIVDIGGFAYEVINKEVESSGNEIYVLETKSRPVQRQYFYADELNKLIAKQIVDEVEPRISDALEAAYMHKTIYGEDFPYYENYSPDMAIRYNVGKPKLSRISPEILELTAQVLEFGSVKYGWDNWKKGLPVNDVMDSLLRHAYAYASGEENDQESGISHLGHIVCNAMFIAYYKKNGIV